ncbi:MAG: hypothetical protein AAF387_22355 [Pseudomonadota bacterium]
MNEQHELENLHRVRTALQQTEDEVEPAIADRLRESRIRILECKTDQDRDTLWTFFANGKYVTPTMLTCSLILVVGLWQGHDGRDKRTPTESFEISHELSVSELELVEELEFYEWLDANGHAG